MSKPEITKYDSRIEQLTKDGLNARQIYMFLNINQRANGLSDVISYSTVYRRYKLYESKYRPWLTQILPHEELFREKKG